MAGGRRRLLWYLLLVVAIFVGYTLLYDWGMSVFEGEPKSLLHSFGIVVETFTTTGFGEDVPWRSVGMQVIMIGMQLTGVSLIFLALPLFIAPWIEETLGTTVPTEVELEDHVVLCGLSSRGETLIDELGSWDREYVIVEPDYDRARRLIERDLTGIHGDPESTETLTDAGVERADVIVADEDDETNASILLSAREVSADVRTIAIVEDEEMIEYLEYAGADEVYSPRQLLGESLANEVTTAVSTEVGDTVEIGSDFQLVEMPIQGGCEILGTSLKESGIRERTGTNVVGLWDEGEFVASPEPTYELDEETVLLVAGSEGQLGELKRLTLSSIRRRARGTVIVVGYGEVGETVSRRIAESSMETVIVDEREKPGVDVVGDGTKADTLRKARIEDAEALILAVGDDTSAMLATLVARELNEDIQIVARANETESTGKMYRAGADYVLALATISGRMVASGVLDEEVIAPEGRVEIVRTEAPALVGETLAGANIRARTGSTVIAVERNGSVLTNPGPDFEFETGDTVIVAGSDPAINQFNEIAHRASGD